MGLGKWLWEIDAAPAEEIIRWKVYAQRYLFGDRRADLHVGILAAQQARIWGRKGCNPNPIDFMPYADDVRPPMKEDWQLSKARIMAFAQAQMLRAKREKRRNKRKCRQAQPSE